MTGTWTLIEADVLDALRAMGDATFDACLADVPYGLGTREPTVEEIVAYLTGGAGLDTGGDFMGADWSVPSVAVWRELLRVLRPGAHLLSFAGTRTQDLITLGIRAGGFEVRDCLQWMHGQGFPKSLDVERAVSMETCQLPGRHFSSTLPKGDKAKPGDHLCPTTPEGAPFDGIGTALKPSYEPIVLAQKPVEGTIARNALTHGTGGLDIDACRVGAGGGTAKESFPKEAPVNAWGRGINGNCEINRDIGKGRWPSNVALSHAAGCRLSGTRKVATGTAHRTNGGGDTFGSDSAKPPLENMSYASEDGTETVEAWDCEPDCPVRLVDEQSGDRPGMSGGGVHREGYAGGMFGGIDSAATARGDSGGASRFFATFAPEAPEGRWPSNVVLSHAPGCKRLGTKRVKGTNPSGPSPGAGRGPGFGHGSGRGQLGAQKYSDEDGTEEVEDWECVADCPVNLLDEQSGELRARGNVTPTKRRQSDGVTGWGIGPDGETDAGDEGGASRFFYCAKASRFERELGCEGLPARAGFEAVGREEGSAGLTPRSGAGRTADKVRNYGPCVKPIALTKYLAALPLPPHRADGRPRRILVPYCGTGSEMIGALRAGWDEVWGIQRAGDDDERGYIAICKARLERWSQVPVDVEPAESREGQRAEAEAREAGQLSLLGRGR